MPTARRTTPTALPTLIGNTIGGVTLVAVLAHAQIVGDKEKRKHDGSLVIEGRGE